MSESTDVISSGPDTPDSSSGAVVQKIDNVPVTEDEVQLANEVVQDLLGPGQQIVSMEKNVTVREEEVLMVNGISISLEGKEGQEIKVN